MIGRRSSARQAAKAASYPPSMESNGPATAGTKRKASSGSQGKSKRGKKNENKVQSTIDASMSTEVNDKSKDVEMEDGPESRSTNVADETAKKDASDGKADNQAGGQADNVAKLHAFEDKWDDDGAETARKVEERTKIETNGAEQPKEDSGTPKQSGFDKLMSNEEEQPEETAEGSGSKVSAQENAVDDSAEGEATTPSSILEKGIIYFFFRGRVGIDEPNSINDVARSYIVLRPLPHGAKLGDGPIGDAGTNRILALPKKVLPTNSKDRFLTFVDKANISMDAIKEQFSSSEYATKTVGVRHTPAATPIGEGVYAITQTGRETHLAYILTIPAELDEVQKEIGLKERGSWITSAKNPQSSTPANAGLPHGAEYPQEILGEFQGRGWMPLQPRLLNYDNTQFLLIGQGDDALEKAAKPQDGEDGDKKTPLEAIENLEEEDEIRVRGLTDDHAVFADLGLSSKQFPNMQTTW